MAIKQTLEDTQNRLDALLTYANGTTGQADISIGDAIKTLCDGYGQGGGDGKIQVSGDIVFSANTDDPIITHNLGKSNYIFVIWTDEDMSGIGFAVRFAIKWLGNLIPKSFGSVNYNGATARNTSNGTAISFSGINTGGDTEATCYAKVGTNLIYVAGKTYHWIAQEI